MNVERPIGQEDPGAATARVRRRDRRGRGVRGPLLPGPPLTFTVPAWRSRAQRFDDHVLDVLEDLERRWGKELGGVEFGVENVPPSDPSPWEHDEVPLGRVFPAQGKRPPRVVLYRRPVETRTEDDTELGALVRHVVVEQVAHLLGRRPDEIDPGHDPG